MESLGGGCKKGVETRSGWLTGLVDWGQSWRGGWRVAESELVERTLVPVEVAFPASCILELGHWLLGLGWNLSKGGGRRKAFS